MADDGSVRGTRLTQELPRLLAGLAVLALLLVVIYRPALDTQLYFDDVANITKNDSLRITSIDGEALRGIRDGISGDRPLAMLSFAFHYYFGAFQPRDFRIINLLLHILNAILIALVTRRLLELREVPPQRALVLTALVTAVWALHPIQLTAVTYVVQRMTSMASLFFWASFYLYLLARMPPSPRLAERLPRIVASGAAVACFLAGMASKQHVIVLPAVVVATEILLFESHKRLDRAGWKQLGVGATVLLVALALSYGDQVAGVLRHATTGLLEPVGDMRGGTPLHRLISLPRVLLLYGSLFFLPVWTRFSLFWQVEPSTGLLQPPATFFATLAVAAVLYAAWRFRQRTPLVSWAVVCFFLAHLLEGTIVPLHLVFEHRMYLPSVFLLLAVVGIAVEVLRGRGRLSAQWQLVSIAAAAVLLGVLMHATLQRNALWGDPIRFFRHQVERNPKNPQAKTQLAQFLLFDDATAPHTALAHAQTLVRELGALEHSKERDAQLLALHTTVGVFYMEKLKDRDSGLSELLTASRYGVNETVLMRLGAFYFHARHDRNVPLLKRLDDAGFAGDEKMLWALELPFQKNVKDWNLVTNLIAAYDFMARSTGDRAYVAKGQQVIETSMRRYARDPRKVQQLRVLWQRLNSRP